MCDQAIGGMLALAACALSCGRPAPDPTGGAAGRKSVETAAAPERAAPAAEEPARGPSIGALDSRVYVRFGPRPTSPEIGVLHIGAVIALRSRDPVSTEGCARGWYAVEPEGFV